ncbi:MAG: hypothetical protein ABSA76_00345 [Bacteroidales bacterium]
MKKLIKLSLVSVLFLSLVAQNSYSQSDDILFRRHLVVSGWNGLLYGAAFDYVFGISGTATAGLPIISAGACVLVPLFTNSSKTITSNQLLLSSHGQTLGWAHGFALAAIINGNDLFDNKSKSKLTVGLGAVTSIGLGILGNSIGKTKTNWSEGRVALYRHYGWVMPETAFCISAAFSNDARFYGAADLLFGAGGYLLADQVNKWHEFTRGEVRSTQALAVMNGALGLCIFADSQTDNSIGNFNRKGWLIPALGTLAGTAVGHLWLKDSNLTTSQGMTTIYATTGGVIIGLGIDLIAKTSDFTTNYLIPYATGMGAYTFAVTKLKHKNASAHALLPSSKKGDWDFSLLPQNIMLNNKIMEKGYTMNGRQIGLQPLFAASYTF